MAFSFIQPHTNFYKPTPDPYRGSGFYMRDPGQELLELRQKNKEKLRRLIEQSQIEKERKRSNFLQTLAGPQNIYTPPRTEAEANFQKLANEDLIGRMNGVNMAPKWDEFRRKEEAQKIDLANKADDYFWQGISRQEQLRNAGQNAGLSRAKLALDVQKFQDNKRRKDESAFLQDLDAEYADAVELISSGVKPEVVGRMFPDLPMQYRQQLAALSRSPVLRSEIDRTTGASMDAERLADEYNRLQSVNKSQFLDDLIAQREKKSPGIFGNALEFFGLRDYPVEPQYDTAKSRAQKAMMERYKTDTAAKKLIRFGPSGWEPIKGSQNRSLPTTSNSVGLMSNEPVRVNSPEELARLRLPRGTPVMLPDGRVFRIK